MPYIFTETEMKCIFLTIDTWEDSFYTDRHIIDPVLFRVLYGTGLRGSEALNLMVKDFDASNNILTVYHTKNNKDRLVPIAPSLARRIAELSDKIHRYSKDTDYLFPSPNGSSIDKSTIYRRFRQYLQRAGISHTDSGPRVHDLRYPYINKIRTFPKETKLLKKSPRERFG